MSAPAVSTRTIIRDTVMQMLESRKGQSICRVKKYAVSPNFLNEQETKQANTYCVIATDEEISADGHGSRDVGLTLKMVLYARDTNDQHAVLDAMIEDAHELMLGLQSQADLRGLVWNVEPNGLTTDEATTAAKDWTQAVCLWTVRFSRA